MAGAKFKAEIRQESDENGLSISEEEKLHFDENGIDQVEFLIAPNPGEGLKPLVKIASGGETSRLMLALKNVLAEVDNIPTLIFDEIDQTLETLIGSDRYTAFLVQFISEFPPRWSTINISRLRLILRRPPTASPIAKMYLEELLTFLVGKPEPRPETFKEIFEAPELTKNPNFEVAIHTIRQTFAESQKFGPDNQSLVDMLLSPSIAVPNSLSGQLEFIREKWASLLGMFSLPFAFGSGCT